MNRIRELRNALNLTQDAFSKKLGLARNTIANYECGRRELTNQVITSICREFNVNEEWIRTGKGEMFKNRLPSDEVGEYVEDLLEYHPENEDERNPFYDMIIEMMRTYNDMDEKSQDTIRMFFKKLQGNIKEEKD